MVYFRYSPHLDSIVSCLQFLHQYDRTPFSLLRNETSFYELLCLDRLIYFDYSYMWHVIFLKNYTLLHP